MADQGGREFAGHHRIPETEVKFDVVGFNQYFEDLHHDSPPGKPELDKILPPASSPAKRSGYEYESCFAIGRHRSGAVGSLIHAPNPPLVEHELPIDWHRNSSTSDFHTRGSRWGLSVLQTKKKPLSKLESGFREWRRRGLNPRPAMRPRDRLRCVAQRF